MLEEEYKEYLVPKDEYDAGFDVTLAIDTSGFPATKKIKKTDDEETAQKIRDENDEVRKTRSTKVNEIAEKISKFKRDFLGAPIRKAFLCAKEGKPFDPCEVPYRSNEKYWLLQPDKSDVQLIFSVHYADTTEQALAKVMMIEFTASQKKVPKAISIAYQANVPAELKAKFPQAAGGSNGFLVLKFNA